MKSLAALPTSVNTFCDPPRRHQGQGAVAFLIVALPLFSLGWLGIEAAHWSASRQILSLALLQAARVGATQGAHPETIRQHFQSRLSPLKAADQRWTISVISPSPAAFDDFTDPDLAPAEGARRAINNSYLDIQHARHLANNWPQGKGPKSQQSIYEANTLTLQLDWAHRPLWTGTSQLLRLLGNDNGSAAQRAWAQGAVAIVRRISVIMQSHPQDWQQRGNSNSPTSPAQSNGNLPATSPPAGAPNESDKPSPPHEAGHKPSDPPFEPPTAANPNEEDSLCGVILCCA